MNAYNYSRKRRMTRNEYRRRKFIEQKLMAFALLIIAAIFIWMTGTANEDAGGGLIAGALGLYLLFTRHIVIV